MFPRLFRPSAVLRSASRASSQVGGQPGQVITIQRVRFFKARNIIRTVFIGGGVGYICYHLYTTAVVSPILRHLEHEYASLSPKERAELAKSAAEDDGYFFLPMPFTTKMVKPEPYRGTDPEWKKFGEISKDKALQEKIRNDLADLAKLAASRSPDLLRRTGTQMSVRRYWLDIDFPYGPPPSFEQSGFLFDEDGIFWASEPVDSLTVMRSRKILWPTAMAQASWAFTSTMMLQHWNQVKTFLGFEAPQASSPFPPSAALGKSSMSSSRQTADGAPTIDAVNAVTKTADQNETEDAVSGGRTSFLKDFASSADGMRQMAVGPWMEFQRKLSQSWKPTKDLPPRGSIKVSGMVELETPRAFVVVDVFGFWDPETRKFPFPSLFMKVRRVQMKVQKPARN